jgi:hypothetical protein
MKTDQEIPLGISSYIGDHFKEDFLFEVKGVKQIKGHSIYTVEVSKDDYIHTLRFNEDGTLIEEKAEQAFPPDIHEEQTSGDIPE